MFNGNHGTPIDPRALNRRATARSDQAGVRHMTVHDAGRTCAMLLVDLEVHPRVIMRILRHADVSMTLEIYANARADGDERSAPQAGGPLRCAGQFSFSLLYWPYFAAVLAAERPSPT
ncbi:MAG TPA: tyrosine-type recombinase/integrase, partial [Dermatophilaceae bacterium]